MQGVVALSPPVAASEAPPDLLSDLLSVWPGIVPVSGRFSECFYRLLTQRDCLGVAPVDVRRLDEVLLCLRLLV